MNARLDRVRALPLHRDLGVQRITSDDGSATLHFTVTDYTVNPAGALHGGVLYTLCDVCAYAALLGVIDDTQEAVTHDLHVSVMSAARLGDVAAWMVRNGRADPSALPAGSLVSIASSVPYAGAPAVCAKTARVIRAICVPYWGKERHHLFHAGVRAAVITLLLVGARQQRRPAGRRVARACRVHRARTGGGPDRAPPGRSGPDARCRVCR